MDIFSLDKETYDNGKLINGIDSLLWVERYNKAGEFIILGTPSLSFRDDLAEGTLISHPQTKSIMMVESHEIDESKTTGSIKLKITGRTIDEVAMDNRILTTSDDDPVAFVDPENITDAPMEFVLEAANAHAQAYTILYRYLVSPYYIPEEVIPELEIYDSVSEDDDLFLERAFPKLGTLSKSVHDLLAYNDHGLKVERKTEDHPDNIRFIIHAGEDVSDTVRFNWNFGDLASARYIWSIKDYKNSAYTDSRYYTLQTIAAGVSGLDMRIMHVDASDWEKFFETFNPLAQLYLASVLYSRAKDELSYHKPAKFIDASVAKDNNYRYGVDYQVGDIVYVDGNYGISSKMRVVEYAIAVDKDGKFGFPTVEPIVE